MENEIIICRCYSPEHQIIFSYTDEEYGEGEVYMTIHLNKLSFLKRLKYGIKYIFGYRCKYGAFDEVVIGKEDKEIFNKLYNQLNK